MRIVAIGKFTYKCYLKASALCRRSHVVPYFVVRRLAIAIAVGQPLA